MGEGLAKPATDCARRAALMDEESIRLEIKYAISGQDVTTSEGRAKAAEHLAAFLRQFSDPPLSAEELEYLRQQVRSLL